MFFLFIIDAVNVFYMKWSYFILIGITCLSLWMIYRARRRRDYPTIPLANAIKHMKTGDLVLFSGRNIGDPTDTEQMIKRVAHLSATYIYRAVDACEFGHVAVVYKDQTTNEVYLVRLFVNFFHLCFFKKKFPIFSV